MSFAYWNDDDKLNVSYVKETNGGKEIIVRIVNKIDHICDVSIVTHPAYEDTSVKARSLDGIKSAIDEQFGEKPQERNAEMMSQYDELMRITRQ
jgi:phage head maturation protease